jgi:hypothetical protein
MRRNAEPPLSSRLCYAVIAVDHVITIGCDFSQEDRARQVSCIDRSFIEAAASAIVRYIDELNKSVGNRSVWACIKANNRVTLNSKMPFGYNSSPGSAEHG